jgi:ADP-heptose:LPS heptosyltransferase
LVKILLIKHGSLGDIISSTAVIRDIRSHHKNAEIYILTNQKYKFFFEESNLINKVLIDNRKGIFSIFYIIKKLLKLKLILIIDLQNSQRTAFYCFIIRIFSNVEISGTSIFATKRYINQNDKMSSVIDGLSNQIECIGIKTSRKPYLDWLDNKSFNFDDLDGKKFFIINPGCSIGNREKRWPAENYALICSYLISKNILPIVIGSQEDSEAINIIMNIEKGILNLFGKSPLDVIFQLSKKAIGAISNDTGPAHLIAASGCKLHLILSNFSNIDRVIPQGSNITFSQKNNIKSITIEEILKKIEIIFKL